VVRFFKRKGRREIKKERGNEINSAGKEQNYGVIPREGGATSRIKPMGGKILTCWIIKRGEKKEKNRMGISSQKTGGGHQRNYS